MHSSCVPLHTQTGAQKADSKTKISFNLVKARQQELQGAHAETTGFLKSCKEQYTMGEE